MENNELLLLSNMSQILSETSEPVKIISAFQEYFSDYGKSTDFVELQNLKIFIYDDNTKTIYDFNKMPISSDCGESYNRLKNIIHQSAKADFFLNGIPYKNMTNLSVNAENQNNIISVPLKKANHTLGIMELLYKNNISNILNQKFFTMLSTAAALITFKIQNDILSEKMQRNIDFYKSMKNIAKIIETQYELSYIIPIIGEMLDRFVTNHLIYIFLRNDKTQNFELVWPSTCRDERIKHLVSRLTEKSKYILTDNDKIGLFPIIGEKNVLGCVVAHSTIDKLNQQELDYIEQLVKQSSITIQRANVYAEALKHATLDALTGLNNRRQFETRLNQEVATAKRQNRPLCAIMLDIDYFKKFNDTYGHSAGDIVLKSVANCIKHSIREYDTASRYGGEEFVILLPSTDIESAYNVAERLRQNVETEKVNITDENSGMENSLSVTISLGVYQYDTNDSAEDLYKNADKALYASKEAGRNRVTINDGTLV